MSSFCLSCEKELKNNEKEYHPSCHTRCFGTKEDYHFTMEQLNKLLEKQISLKETISGVQKKLSWTPMPPKKATMTSRSYIIKFPSGQYPYITEMENLVMCLADECGIPTVPHTLIKVDNNEYVYLTRRIDKETGNKKQHRIPIEDFCQLSERLTEEKYKGSYERFSALLDRYSSMPLRDKTQILIRILFCFLTGNNDMHLKNFSLWNPNQTGYTLTPAYDLLNVNLINPKDEEEVALSLNGKKKNLQREDFLELAKSYGISEKVYHNIVRDLSSHLPNMKVFILNSFLSEELKQSFLQMLEERSKRI